MSRFLLPLLLLTAAGVAGPSLDELMRDRGLVPNGFLIVVPAEADVHAQARQLRAIKGKIASEAYQRHDIDNSIKEADEAIDRLSDQLAPIGNRAEADGLIQQLNIEKSRVVELKERREKMPDSRGDYVTLTLSLLDKSQSAMDAYRGFSKDAQLAAAIAQNNANATLKLKLGPSGLFVDDFNFIKQCGGDVSTASVPVDQTSGVPVVRAVINGKLNQSMVWDSGASIVTLTALTADALGLHPGPHDLPVNMKVADGRVVKAIQMHLDSIRVGPFTAKDIDCVVMPKTAKGVGDLLGDTFQRHFLCRLDLATGELHLTPLDAQSAPGANKAAAAATTQPN